MFMFDVNYFSFNLNVDKFLKFVRYPMHCFYLTIVYNFSFIAVYYFHFAPPPLRIITCFVCIVGGSVQVFPCNNLDFRRCCMYTG